MSATAATPPAPAQPAAGLSPVEYVMGLSFDQQVDVLYALLEKALTECDEPIAVPLEREGEAPMAYLLSAKEYDALQKQYQFPHASDDDYEAKRTPRSERDWVTMEEAMDWLDEEDEEAESEPSPAPTASGSAAAE